MWKIAAKIQLNNNPIKIHHSHNVARACSPHRRCGQVPTYSNSSSQLPSSSSNTQTIPNVRPGDHQITKRIHARRRRSAEAPRVPPAVHLSIFLLMQKVQ